MSEGLPFNKNRVMEIQSENAMSSVPQVKITFGLGSETYSLNSDKGILSEQLVSMKEQSMSILKDFITKHNVSNDVPDEPIEGGSEDDEIDENPQVKSKKTKTK